MELGAATPLLARISCSDECTTEIPLGQQEADLVDSKLRLLRPSHNRTVRVQAGIHEVRQSVGNVIQDRFRLGCVPPMQVDNELPNACYQVRNIL